MSTSENETGISDEQLPEDLVASDDNPLAKPLPDDVEVDLHEGKIADEMDDPEGDPSESGDTAEDTDGSQDA